MCRSHIALVAFIGCCSSPAHGQQTTALDDTHIVNALAPELTNARVSTAEALTVEQRAMLARGGAALGFRFERDLNGDGVTDLLVLGDYQDGLVHSTFALIATRSSGQWLRAALLTFHEDFIVGEMSPKGAFVVFCLSCDHGGRIKWTGSSYAFDWYHPGPKAPSHPEAEGDDP